VPIVDQQKQQDNEQLQQPPHPRRQRRCEQASHEPTIGLTTLTRIRQLWWMHQQTSGCTGGCSSAFTSASLCHRRPCGRFTRSLAAHWAPLHAGNGFPRIPPPGKKTEAADAEALSPTSEEAARILAAAWEQDPDWGTLVWLTMVTGASRRTAHPALVRRPPGRCRAGGPAQLQPAARQVKGDGHQDSPDAQTRTGRRHRRAPSQVSPAIRGPSLSTWH
jgi:hypothetical protein